MTVAYRQKLLHFHISMMVLIFFTIVAVVVNYTQSRMCTFAEERTLCLISIGEALKVFMLGGLFAAMPWHFGELLQKREPTNPVWRRLLSYRTFFILGFIAIFLMVLTGFRQLEVVIYYSSFFGPHGYYAPHALVRYPLYVLSLTMVVICCCKLVYAAKSRFSKAQ